MKTWMLVLLTWFGDVDTKTQEIPVADLRDCNRQIALYEKEWADAPKEFVSVMYCKQGKIHYD